MAETLNVAALEEAAKAICPRGEAWRRDERRYRDDARAAIQAYFAALKAQKVPSERSTADTPDLEAQIRKALFDPGQFVEREFYPSQFPPTDPEPLHAWQARAVVQVLSGGSGEEVLREDFEQVVTDILVALDDWTALPEGPDVDDAREAVMRELLTFARLFRGSGEVPARDRCTCDRDTIAENMATPGCPAHAPEFAGEVPAGLTREADNLRFQLGRLIADAEVLGDDMDAPVRFRTDIEAVTLTSLHTFLKRYDEARAALRGGSGEVPARRWTEEDVDRALGHYHVAYHTEFPQGGEMERGEGD